MSSVKDKNIVSEAMIDMENIKKAIKEESKQTIANLLNETVKNSIREAIEDDEKEDKATEKEGKKQKKTPAAEPAKDGEEEESEEVVDIEDDNDEEKPEEDDDFAEYSEYKVDDDTYDLSGEKDNDKVVSVYKKLGDDDVVVTVDDCTVNLKDNETGAEYVLDLGNDCCEKSCGEINEELLTGDDDTDDDTEDFEIDTDDDTEDFEIDTDDDTEDFEIDTDDDDSIDLDGELSDLGSEDSKDESEFEIEDEDEPAGIPDLKEGRNSMRKNNERIFEVDLGYTDNYQSKDVIDGHSMEEPSKSGRNWDKGLPTGTKKPWAGSTKGKGMPFTQNVNECGAVPPVEDGLEEGTNVTLPNSRKKVKSHTPDTGKKNYPKNAHHDSVGGEYYAERMNEAIKLNKAYKKEIAELREAVGQLKKSLNETYLTNVNLGQIARLFVENTTTRAEKQDIISRFGNVKSTKDAKRLYESVSKELKAKSPKNPVMENSVKKAAANHSAKKQVMNESLSKIHDFMNRIALY